MSHKLYVEPLWHIFLNLEKFRQMILKIQRRRPPVEDMPGHKWSKVLPKIFRAVPKF